MNDCYQKAALSEYEVSLRDFKKSKQVLPSLKKSYLRYNSLIAKATEASLTKPACKAGCSYCCYYKVEVKAHELLLIHDYMLKHFSSEEIDAVLNEAAVNAEQIKTLTSEEHLTTNIKCPLLKNNQCSVYEARPYKCRNFHATDVKGCEDSYLNPASFSISSNLIENIAMYGDAHSQGFEEAAKQAGFDNRTYDLTTGLLAVFKEANATKRFFHGKKSFPSAIEITDIS